MSKIECPRCYTADVRPTPKHAESWPQEYCCDHCAHYFTVKADGERIAGRERLPAPLGTLQRLIELLLTIPASIVYLAREHGRRRGAVARAFVALEFRRIASDLP